jgi:quercetin dioxygenase-like cupin family protein
MSNEEKRERPHSTERSHPTERFAGDNHFFDLGHALKQLRGEAHEARKGHRQVTVFHRVPVTQVLFDFERGGELTEHAANGLVTIHALEGHLTVRTAGATHELRAGMLVVLNPNVRHSVHAIEASAMLLTVHLENRL